MKIRYIAALAAWLMAIALIACAAPKQEALPEAEPSVQIPNPMVEVPSAEEIGTALGFAFPLPPESAEDVRCFVISNAIGHMTFTYDAQPYMLRAAKDAEEDISGLYVQYETTVLEQAIEDDLMSMSILLRYIKTGGVTVSWEDAGVSYVLYAEEECVRPGESTGECDALDLAYRMTRSLYMGR